MAVDADGSPVSVSWSGDARRNIIVWMDHRAVNQAERINSSKSPVLQYCGGALSPEMQAPKVLFLVVHNKQTIQYSLIQLLFSKNIPEFLLCALCSCYGLKKT